MSPGLMSWEEAVGWLRTQPDQQELVHFCYYDDPLEQAAERFRCSDEWLGVLKILRKSIPGSVLDIGAGRGISSYAFAKAGCKVTALEPDPSMLVGAGAIKALRAATSLDIEVVEQHAERLPFEDNTFDIVYGRAVFHHARNLNEFCNEVFRVLKPQGVFIVTREHVLSNKSDLTAFLQAHPLHSLYGGENAYLLQEYLDAIHSSGLKVKQAIGPFESAVNYFPASRSNIQTLIRNEMPAFLRSSLLKPFISNPVIEDYFSRQASLKCEVPGRHYSFVASKPNKTDSST